MHRADSHPRQDPPPVEAVIHIMIRGLSAGVESGEWMIGWSRRHAGYGGIESIILCGC